jgi:hypothetical protein
VRGFESHPLRHTYEGKSFAYIERVGVDPTLFAVYMKMRNQLPCEPCRSGVCRSNGGSLVAAFLRRGAGKICANAYRRRIRNTLRLMEVSLMPKQRKFKENKGNHYKHNSEFAEEVIKKNERHNPYPVQQELNVQDR